MFLTFRSYAKSWITADLLAAILLFVIALPEQLATAHLAGMAPLTGLIAFLAGTVAVVVLGSSPVLSVGADSTIAPLIAVGLAHFALPGSTPYIALMGIITVEVGIIVGCVGLFKLGWLADLLSAPIIAGFLAGVGLIIIVHQLPDIFGIHDAGGSTVARIVTVLTHLGATNFWCLGIGVGVLVIIEGLERINNKIPAALIALIASCIIAAVFNLSAHGVLVLGHITASFPPFGLHGLTMQAVIELVPIAFIVAVVVVSQTAATTRAFSPSLASLDVGRDFLATGVGSILAGLFGSFAVDASPARTAAVAHAGGKSQLSGVIAFLGILIMIPLIFLLQDLPYATLAAVLVYVALRIFHIHDLVNIFRFDLWEFGLALVTFIMVAFVGVEQGIILAVILAVFDRTRISARPRGTVMGRIPGTTSWESVHHAQNLETIPGTLVFLFPSALYFANATYFQTQLLDVVAKASPRYSTVVLDCAAITDTDFTGIATLREILSHFAQSHITCKLARVDDELRHNLTTAGLLTGTAAPSIYSSVNEAATSQAA
ncbi:MAG: SulP family inorganic anion transporter [Candidatus Dormibacteria bacterium]